MKHVERIDASITEVFDFVLDARNFAGLYPRSVSIRKASAGPVAVGTVFETKRSRFVARTVITEYERPARAAAVTGRQRALSSFRATDHGTVVETDVPWPYLDAPRWFWPILALLTPIVGGLVTAQLHRAADLTRLALETSDDSDEVRGWWTPDPNRSIARMYRTYPLYWIGLAVATAVVTSLVLN
jgi:hypothetical protein